MLESRISSPLGPGCPLWLPPGRSDHTHKDVGLNADVGSTPDICFAPI